MSEFLPCRNQSPNSRAGAGNRPASMASCQNGVSMTLSPKPMAPSHGSEYGANASSEIVTAATTHGSGTWGSDPSTPPAARGPYAHLLNTNTPPTDAEAATLRRIVQGANTKLAPLDEAIRKLEATLEQFKARRAPLQDFLDAHCPVLSPLRRIPDDVLREIFTHVGGTFEENYRLGAICCQWRRVSHGMPFLWRGIEVTAKKPESEQLRVLWQLERAKLVPLHLSLEFVAREWEKDKSTRDASDILDTLFPHFLRCDDMYMSLEEEHVNEMADLQVALPRVKSLRIHMQWLPPRMAPIFGTLVSLKKLSLHTWVGIPDAVLLALPWQQLRICSLGELSRYAIMQILPLLPTDAQLTLTMCHPYVGDTPPDSVHTSIATLTFEDCTPRFTNPLLAILHAPRLTKLDFARNSDEQSPEQLDIIAQFLLRTQHALTHLALYLPVPTPADPLEELLSSESLQTVKNLKLVFDDRGKPEDELAEAVIEFLADHPNAMSALHSLAVSAARRLDDEPFIDLWASRRDTLRVLRLESRRWGSADRVVLCPAAVEVLRGDGLDIIVSDYLNSW
ncbi:hypothetical protein GGX14DRAFT_637661 [Mycena pura]|uniref:F-box domain-containing protein n=1 Tax=Mycena pura TaxID=153505 RepID=A0AAD6VDD5_9AGAR|nr:hypothetical protein GGX14DRAFT_637661 [Mycena pura]